MNFVAKYYSKWINSDPFDKGNTTVNAFKILARKPEATKAIKAALKHNKESLSNGSLMKI